MSSGSLVVVDKILLNLSIYTMDKHRYRK